MSQPLRVAGARRRTVVQGLGAAITALAVAGLSGCETDSESSTPAAPPTPDPDAILRDHVVSVITEQAALVAAVITAMPALADRLGQWQALHAEQLRVFAPSTASPSPTSASPPVSVELPTRRPLAVRRVMEGERALATTLAESVLTARSGSLARVLASAAAGVDQQLLAHRSVPAEVAP